MHLFRTNMKSFAVMGRRFWSPRFLIRKSIDRYFSDGETPVAVGQKSAVKDEPDRLQSFPPQLIRNFCIIAHVDHGKSTLADRLLETTGTIERNSDNAQVLDTLQVERERGITIKAQTASMFYTSPSNDRTYLLNLIDTPGHADFGYEVSRSLAACQGALLLVDVSQGVQAQTVANFWLGFEMDVHMIGVLNKIDVAKNRQIDEAASQMESLFDLEAKNCLKVSAKTGQGIDDVLEAVVRLVPPPESDREKSMRALIFDSWYDQYRGCYLIVLVKDGFLKKGQAITAMHSGKQYEVQEVGILCPNPRVVPALYAGQVGYVTANIRHPRETQVGDTLRWTESNSSIIALPGFRQSKPMVFSGLFPVDPADYEALKSALAKLTLTDPAVTVALDNSAALGAGWRCGFLGVLHMEVFNQRLENDFRASTIMTTPSVPYRALIKDNTTIRRRYDGRAEIDVVDPSKFPELPTDVESYLEPIAECTIIAPSDYGPEVRALIGGRRGSISNESMVDDRRILFKFRLPLAEVIVDFIGALRRATSGFGSFDYELADYIPADLVKIRILINGRSVDEFARIVLKNQARPCGLELCQKLKELIPRQQYEVEIKAAVGGKVIAQSVIKPMKKDFTGKLKGNFGDHTRLRKLLDNQKEGKKRLKLLGNVEIPKEAFLSIMRKD